MTANPVIVKKNMKKWTPLKMIRKSSNWVIISEKFKIRLNKIRRIKKIGKILHLTFNSPSLNQIQKKTLMMKWTRQIKRKSTSLVME